MTQPSPPQEEQEPVLETVAEPLHELLQQETRRPVSLGIENGHARPSTRTRRFRPLERPPLGILTVLDDGSSETGEVIRIRRSRFLIGRKQGDLTIPFDPDISSRHLELRCQRKDGEYRWFLLDLGSTNGTFLRAYRASLARDTELLLGSRRYLFQLPERDSDSDCLAEAESLKTQEFRAPERAAYQQPYLTLREVGAEESRNRSIEIRQEDLLLGRDESCCGVAIKDDPFLSPKHARLYREPNGRWMIDDKKSLNGVWIRVKRMTLPEPAEFQIGWQRFHFHPGGI